MLFMCPILGIRGEVDLVVSVCFEVGSGWWRYVVLSVWNSNWNLGLVCELGVGVGM